MKNKKTAVRRVFVLVLALSLSAIISTAQESQTKPKKGKSVTVTGCLQKGDEAGEYSILAQDGKRYGLRSKKVDLSKHLGHKVAVTGMTKREENESGEGEYADLSVTSLKMVSESCQ